MESLKNIDKLPLKAVEQRRVDGIVHRKKKPGRAKMVGISTYQIRLLDSLNDRLNVMSAAKGLSRRQIIEQALDNFLLKNQF